MSWLIVGTVPYRDFPLVHGSCSMSLGKLRLVDQTIPVVRGTPALLAAACLTARCLGLEPPRALLAGDIGMGDGSRLVYRDLVKEPEYMREKLIVFHYLQPDVDWHNRILMRLEDEPEMPILVADAGYMYVAKMSGFASSYDLFTPDAGEMAFLADESAPHPFYTRGFLLQEEERISDLIQRAYQHTNAARHLLVKGHRDLVASENGVITEISQPCVKNMEPIGGTGDSLTGIVSALIGSGRSVPDSAVLGAIMNRTMGSLTSPTPAWSIADLLSSLPEAVEAVLSQKYSFLR